MKKKSILLLEISITKKKFFDHIIICHLLQMIYEIL